MLLADTLSSFHGLTTYFPRPRFHGIPERLASPRIAPRGRGPASRADDPEADDPRRVASRRNSNDEPSPPAGFSRQPTP